MGVIRAFSGALSGTLSDQWKDIYTAQPFDEHSALVKGIKKSTKNGRKTDSSDSVITNGSIIYVPENTACVIFSQGMIEEIITTAGGYKYTNGQSSVFTTKNPLLLSGIRLKKDLPSVGFRPIINKSHTSTYGKSETSDLEQNKNNLILTHFMNVSCTLLRTEFSP